MDGMKSKRRFMKSIGRDAQYEWRKHWINGLIKDANAELLQSIMVIRRGVNSIYPQCVVVRLKKQEVESLLFIKGKGQIFDLALNEEKHLSSKPEAFNADLSEHKKFRINTAMRLMACTLHIRTVSLIESCFGALPKGRFQDILTRLSSKLATVVTSSVWKLRKYREKEHRKRHPERDNNLLFVYLIILRLLWS